MKQVVVMVCLSLFLASADGRLTMAELRKTLGGINPLFSHERNRPDPFMQNVNIRLPVSDPAVQDTNDRVPNTAQMTSEVRTNVLPANSNANPTAKEARSKARPSKSRPATSGASTSGRGTPVKQKNRMAPVRAGKPSRQPEVKLGQVRPNMVPKQEHVQSSMKAPVQGQQHTAVADHSTNTMGDQATKNPSPPPSAANVKVQPAAVEKPKCDFIIPSFFMPDPSSEATSSQSCPLYLFSDSSIITVLLSLMDEHMTGSQTTGTHQINRVKNQISQVQLEQKCLMPALRAYILGGTPCKTYEMKIYLEWLLYLRQRLFNI